VRRWAAALGALAALVLAGCGGGGGGTTTTSPPAALLHPARLKATVPASFRVEFDTTRGTFVVTVRRAWAPEGAARFYELVHAHFYDGVKFFRVVPGFVVQFGISPFPQVSRAWEHATIPDDPVREHNRKGALTFASAGPGTRTTQLFVNLADNLTLDSQGFAPIGVVTKGLAVVEKLYSGYGDAPTPQQSEMSQEGNAFLDQHYPKLDAIKTATIAR
jgi:peptidyl-prolyl cis-trans isomerase A (cyclophilin A)